MFRKIESDDKLRGKVKLIGIISRTYGPEIGWRELEALLDALEAVGRYVVAHHGTIVELDINPLIVGGVGTDPVVADARITLSKPSQ